MKQEHCWWLSIKSLSHKKHAKNWLGKIKQKCQGKNKIKTNIATVKVAKKSETDKETDKSLNTWNFEKKFLHV